MSSMAAMAIRIIAKNLIKNANTIAGDNVQDSAIDPLSFLDDDKSVPVVVISSEDETALLGSRNVNSGERTSTFCIELAIGQLGEFKLDDGTVEKTFNVESTDAAAEAMLSVLQRQIKRALFGGQGGDFELFTRFVPVVQKETVKRGIPTEHGARFAARLIEIEHTPLNDPAFGEDLPPVWKDFLDFVEAKEGATPRGLFEAALNGAPVAPEVLAQVSGGWTSAEAAALRLDGI